MKLFMFMKDDVRNTGHTKNNKTEMHTVARVLRENPTTKEDYLKQKGQINAQRSRSS